MDTHIQVRLRILNSLIGLKKQIGELLRRLCSSSGFCTSCAAPSAAVASAGLTNSRSPMYTPCPACLYTAVSSVSSAVLLAVSSRTPWTPYFSTASPGGGCIGRLDQKLYTFCKSDMERGIVMDRLLCGDVGYGKTEVALRAIFKTVTEGR